MGGIISITISFICIKIFVLRHGILEMNLIFVNKVDIFIHHPGQFFSPDSRARVDISPDHYKKIAINHEIVRLLSGTGECSDVVSFDDCLQESLLTTMMEG